MKKKIEVISESRAYDGYLKIEEAIIKETDSEDQVQYSRFALKRPDAAAILVYNADEDTVILVKQHRYPAHVHGISEDIYEIPAGKVDGDEKPEAAAIREVKEEIGYDIKEGNMIFVSKYFPSVGYSSEMIHLYAATVTNSDKTSEGGGAEGEHENIDIYDVPATEVFNMISSGEIIDGKTIMGASKLWRLRNDQFVKLGKQYYEILRLENEASNQDIKDADETTK